MNCDQKLLQAFELTSTGKHIEQVESYFQEAQKDRFFLEKLFVIINDQSSTIRAKIGAAGLLQKKLKNTLNLKNDIPMDYYDLNLIKQGIIHSIANIQDLKVQKNLEEILTILINTFYPQNWPDLIQEIMALIKDSNTLEQIYGNIRVIYCIFQSYRQADEQNLKKFNNALIQLFPYIENIAIQGLSKIEEKFLPILLTIIKIFLNVSQSQIPSYLDEKKLKLWCFILKQSQQLNIGIEQYQKPQCYDDMFKLEKTQLFQVRINSVQALSRLCMIFSNTKKYLKTLLQNFISVLPSILDQGLSYLDQTLTNDSYVYSITEISEVYRMLFYSIQIHYNQEEKEIFSDNLLNTIIYELLVNHMQIHQYAQDLFAQDINQYIYSCKNMAHEPTMMLRQQVGNVLTIILKNDENFIKSYLEFSFKVIANNFNPYTKQPASLQLQESVLFGIESCIYHIQIILNHKMDSLVEKLIIPSLNSNNPFLQAQACCVIKELKECEILDMNLVVQMSQRICKFVQSENLYLRIKSINALQLISTIEETHPYFKNDLQIILKTIFETMQLISIEDLSDCLKTLVEEFQTFISPFAMQITDNVLRQFWDVVDNKEINDIDDDIEQVDFIDQLESCLNTIGNILWCDLDQNFYEQSINWLTNIMAYILTQKQVFTGLQDAVLELFSVFIFQIKNLDDQVLMFYPFLCYSMFGPPQNSQPSTNLDFMTESQKKLFNNRVIGQFNNINCIEKYVGIFGNFIQKGYDIIMTKNDFYGKRLLEYFFDFVDALIAKGMNQKSDLELLFAIKLLSFLFENNYKKLITNYEHFMQEICRYFQNLLEQNRGPTLKSAIHQKYCQMLFLNPKITLNIWRKLNIYETVLYGIFGSLDLFVDVDDKSNLLLGIIGLLKLDLQDFPAIIPLSSLMRELLQVVVFLSEEHQKKALFEEEDESYQGSDVDRTFNEEEIFEQSDFNYMSPFDNINEIDELKNVLNEIEKQNFKYFQKLLNELSSNEQGTLKERMLYFENVNKQIQIYTIYQKKLKQIYLVQIKINYKLQMAKPSTDCVQSYHVGLNKGFSVTKLKRPERPSSRKGKTSQRVREIRKIVQSVAEFSPFEKRVIEMLKTGVAQVEKRAFKLLRKRLGKRSRAIKKRDNINQFIRAQAAKNKSANN